MEYKVIVSPRAQIEIENAIDYYILQSDKASAKFISIIKQAYEILESTPYLRIRYKNIRGIKLKRFPYSLFFVINERKSTVRVLSCFHNKRDPKNRPEK